MKKVLSIVLIFAVVLAALLGISALWERVRPVRETVQEEPKEQKTIANAMDAAGATVITLAQDGTTVSGLGAEVQDNRVVIGYPGTYRVTGTLESGQIIVDLGEFSGAAYILLDGVSVACDDGPALYVRQADLTAVYLTEGTENTLRDGEDYLVQEVQEKKTGAGIYSADDLLIYGDGALTVIGASADGIRSKDALIVAGGTLRVNAADDGMQASDLLDIYAGDITVSCYGDGLSTTEGSVTVYGGSVDIRCGGDGFDAITDLTVWDGSISVTAYGGAENYETIALEEISAKGMKAEMIGLYGGTIRLDTADDGIHAARDAAISDCSLVITAGDDAVHAANLLDIRRSELVASASYEGVEGDAVLISETALTVTAENNAVDAGEGGVTAYDSEFVFTAPRAISSDGVLHMLGGSVTLMADGTDSLFSFAEANVIGARILAGADTGRSEVLLAKGMIPGSMLFGFAEALPAGTELVITDPSGEVVFSAAFDRDVETVYLALGGLLEGQTYTLTAGENAVQFTYAADGCFIEEPEITFPQGGFGGFPGFPGGPRR